MIVHPPNWLDVVIVKVSPNAVFMYLYAAIKVNLCPEI
jgi:hypothetical protein